MLTLCLTNHSWLKFVEALEGIHAELYLQSTVKSSSKTVVQFLQNKKMIHCFDYFYTIYDQDQDNMIMISQTVRINYNVFEEPFSLLPFRYNSQVAYLIVRNWYFCLLIFKTVDIQNIFISTFTTPSSCGKGNRNWW